MSSELCARFAASLAPLGFDLVQPCRVGWYNDLVDGDLRLEDWGSPHNLALVVGNTRALWQPFLAALAREPVLLERGDPLNRYTEREVQRAAHALAAPYATRWAHDTGSGLVAMQRLAHVSGLAYLSASHLSVHPVFGPWIALRAVLTFPRPGPDVPPALQHPCGDCRSHCLPAFERALRASARHRALQVGEGSNAPQIPAPASMEAEWRAWLACRDACPTGRAFRYSDPQIEYHYTKQVSVLTAGLAKIPVP
jgi:cyanocobalamin reductase (cyanide-eliminating) / alkylcobalamin dealkylase